MLDSLFASMGGYFGSLKLSALMRALPGGFAQGMIWGILALGVFMTFRMLGVSDLTVDGSMATGGAVCIMLVLKGVNPQLALLAIPDILAGILTQISLYSINLNIMGKANQAVNVNKISFLFTSNAKLLTRTIWIVFGVCVAWFRCSICIWARSMAPPSGLPASTATWPGPRASTPTG